ncbi:DUF1453 domain-containing protein [Streptomyces sp. NPDC050560]|uniref:DUF1453 domain-containing protein n=1 Tax=Streptomyces sp. NPDC050560 TaxID=3365630 RepID=UPI003797979B
MSGLTTVLIALAVIALVVVRLTRAQQVSGQGRWWVVPVVLIFVGAREPGVYDPHHAAGSVALLAAGLVVSVLVGLGWGYTSRLWRADDGTVWARGSAAAIGIWAVGVALRGGLMGLGALFGIHEGSGALLLALAPSLLLRSMVLIHRSSALSPGDGSAPAYGGRVGAGQGKDRKW